MYVDLMLAHMLHFRKELHKLKATSYKNKITFRPVIHEKDIFLSFLLYAHICLYKTKSP